MPSHAQPHSQENTLLTQLDALRASFSSKDMEAARAAALQLCRPWLQEQREQAKLAFLSGGDVRDLLPRLSAQIDQLLQALFAFTGSLTGESDSLTIIATGGYGRAELFPYSDIDLLFLHRSRMETGKALSEFILYILWDLGLKVGQAHRSIDESITAAREDFTVRTTLLDARLIAGNAGFFEELQRRFQQDIIATDGLAFVEAKLKERDDRHARLGDSRFLLEPNVKDGKGALRDLHTLYWLAKYHYPITQIADLVPLQVVTAEEARLFTRAQHYLWSLRAHLHYIAGRAEERLTFDVQKSLAKAMGYHDAEGSRAVQRLMKRYFLTARAVGSLTRIFCAVLEAEKKRKPRLSLTQLLRKPQRLGPFILEGERLNVSDDELFQHEPVQILNLFRLAQLHELDIHPKALQLLSRSLRLVDRDLQENDEANRLFIEMLTDTRHAETTLRRLNESGVLSRFLPEFGRIVGQMQFDMYHIYTVDEHTIVAIGVLHAIARNELMADSPLASEVIHRVQSRATLFLAMLCHDIAKGRGGNHAETGERIVLKLAKRFGLNEHEAETAAWLVRHHLLFSDTAFKRDIDDPQTVRDFVAVVQTPERLRLLLLITVADMRAVGPRIWNGWKGGLLRDLFYRAEASMGTGHVGLPPSQASVLRAGLAGLLPRWREDEIEDYLQLGSAAFWTSCDLETHAGIARMLREMQQLGLPLSLDTHTDPFRAVTQIAICTNDQPGLFSKIAGTLALCGANIVSAKVFTLKNGMAVDIFLVQDANEKPFNKPDKLARLSVMLESVLSGEKDLVQEFASLRRSWPTRRDALNVTAQVHITNDASAAFTIIEVTGRDRIGFLYRVTRCLAEQSLSIGTAHISTYGEHAVDVFYVKDIFGMKITHPTKLAQVREALLKVLLEHGDALRLAS